MNVLIVYGTLFREAIEENIKLKREKDSQESQILVLKNEINSSKKCIEQLEVNR